MNLDPNENTNRVSGLEHLTPPEHNDSELQVTLPVLRESVLPNVFPLSEVEVCFPQPKPTLLNTVMYYTIRFVWNGEHREIIRRFSDIQKFRSQLEALLPFTYIFPVHRKKLIVVSSEHNGRTLPGGSDRRDQQVLQLHHIAIAFVQPRWTHKSLCTTSSRRNLTTTRPSSLCLNKTHLL